MRKPVESGLYWAYHKRLKDNQYLDPYYHVVVLLSGNAPFLRWTVVYNANPVYEVTDPSDLIWGPRINEPEVNDGQEK